MAEPPRVAIVHDYLTQWGGAERVVLVLKRAFPDAPIYTSFYDPATTFPEFGPLDVRTLPINRLGVLRRRHRVALPFLARAFSRARIDADIAVCTSSGWAHGASVTGRKVVYCHTPAHWLYARDEYLPAEAATARALLRVIGPGLRRWDQRAAASAERYIANSEMIRDRIQAAYGINAEVVHPPPAIDAGGTRRPVEGIEPGFVLCVSRLVQYKNVRPAVAAFASLPGLRLVVVGDGPLRSELTAAATENVTILGTLADDELRWLYANAIGLVGAAYEDFGLAPLEAAVFGKPTAALHYGGYLDTVREGETGVFFESADAERIAAAVARLVSRPWDADRLREHAASFGEARFINRLRAIVDDEAQRCGFAPLAPLAPLALSRAVPRGQAGDAARRS